MISEMYAELLHRHALHLASLLLNELVRQQDAAARCRAPWRSCSHRKSRSALVESKRVQVRQAGLEQNISPRGLLALIIVEPI
eukprot:1858322-Pleurochrysis_carterae.AAC.1